MNDILLAVLLAVPSSPAAAPKAAPISPMTRLSDMYAEARAAHLLSEERAKRVISLKPFDSLGRRHEDYQHAVGFLESRSIAPASLQKAVAALPKTLPPGNWARYLIVLTQKELRHLEEDRTAALGYIAKNTGFGPEVAGLTPWAQLEARTVALFASHASSLKRVDALAIPLEKDAALPYSDPGYSYYVRANARVLRRVVGAMTADTDRLVAEQASLTKAELKRIFGTNFESFEVGAAGIFRGLGADLKNCPAFTGEGAVQAAAALKDLEAAAADAARARGAFAAVKARVDELDAAVLANYKEEEDDMYGPDTLIGSYNDWGRDLEKLEKGCRETAAALAAKLPAKP